MDNLVELLSKVPSWFDAFLIILLFWLLQDAWKDKRKKSDKHDDLLQQNTLALTELRVEIRNLKDLLLTLNTRIDNNERDIDALHMAKREWMKNGK